LFHFSPQKLDVVSRPLCLKILVTYRNPDRIPLHFPPPNSRNVDYRAIVLAAFSYGIGVAQTHPSRQPPMIPLSCWLLLAPRPMPSSGVMKATKTIYLLRFERGPFGKQFLAAWTDHWTYVPTRLPANASTFTSKAQAATVAQCLDLTGLAEVVAFHLPA
jgi:hypothetical protein